MLKGILELWLDYMKGCGLILVALIVRDGFSNVTVLNWIMLAISISVAFALKAFIIDIQKREDKK